MHDRAILGDDERVSDVERLVLGLLDRGFGFLCYQHSSEAFWDSIKRAGELFRDRLVWPALIKRAMQCEFSWDRSASRYEQVYAELVGEPQGSEAAA